MVQFDKLYLVCIAGYFRNFSFKIWINIVGQVSLFISELFANYLFGAKHTANVIAGKVTIEAVCFEYSDLFRGLHFHVQIIGLCKAKYSLALKFPYHFPFIVTSIFKDISVYGTINSDNELHQQKSFVLAPSQWSVNKALSHDSLSPCKVLQSHWLLIQMCIMPSCLQQQTLDPLGCDWYLYISYHWHVAIAAVRPWWCMPKWQYGRDSSGARLCVNAAPICEKAHHFLPCVP